MIWKDIVKGNAPRGPMRMPKERRRTQDELFDEANRNMRSDRFNPPSNITPFPRDLRVFKNNIMRMFPDNYNQEDLDKFKNSVALRNLHRMFRKMRRD